MISVRQIPKASGGIRESFRFAETTETWCDHDRRPLAVVMRVSPVQERPYRGRPCRAAAPTTPVPGGFRDSRSCAFRRLEYDVIQHIWIGVKFLVDSLDEPPQYVRNLLHVSLREYIEANTNLIAAVTMDTVVSVLDCFK
jgi:hypothetical protein